MNSKHPSRPSAPGNHRVVRAFLALSVLATVLSTAPVRAESPSAWLDERIDLDLEAAQADQVLTAFAQILEVQPEIDPEVAGEVTITLFNVTARTALNATCESLGCRWRLVTADPPRLIVEPQPQPKTREPGIEASLSVKLDRASARDAFETLARIGGLSIVLEPGVDGKVSMTLANRPVVEVLDRLCLQVDCRWEITEVSTGTLLRVRPNVSPE